MKHRKIRIPAIVKVKNLDEKEFSEELLSGWLALLGINSSVIESEESCEEQLKEINK